MNEIIDLDTMTGFWPQRQVDISTGRLLQMMDQHGVRRACVVSARGALFDHFEGNDETLAWCREQPRFIPVGTIDLRRFQGYREEIQRLTEAGVRLWRLFPEYQGWTPDQAVLRRVLDALEAVGAVLFLGGQPSAVARAVEGTTVTTILGLHFYQASDFLALLETGTNLYVSTRLLHGPGAVKVLVEAMGHQRLIFGSGAPLSSMGSGLRCLEVAALSDEQRAAIMGGNLQRLLADGGRT